MSWLDWAAGVCGGIGAPLSWATEDSLFAWSNAETAPFDLMRWNNPLNTTEPGFGGVDMNSVGVKAYPTVQDGINATVTTLLNGRYPIIVSHLQNSVPRSAWGDACAELDTWGTGCGWLNTVFGAGGGSVTGDDFLSALSDEAQVNMAFRIADLHKILVDSTQASPESYPGNALPVPNVEAPGSLAVGRQLAAVDPSAQLQLIETQISQFIIPMLQDVKAKVDAAGPGTVDLSPVLDALKALTLKAA